MIPYNREQMTIPPNGQPLEQQPQGRPLPAAVVLP